MRRNLVMIFTFGLLALVALVAYRVLVIKPNSQANTEVNAHKDEATTTAATDTQTQAAQKTQTTPEDASKVSAEPIDEQAAAFGLAPGWEDQWIAQLEPHRYSPDLAVELVSVAFEFENCGNNRPTFNNADRLDAQQIAIMKQAEQRCQQLVSQYPLLEDNEIQGGMQFVFQRFPTSTPLGQLMYAQSQPDQRLDHQPFIDQFLPMAIQAENAQLITLVNLISWNMRYRDAIEAELINSTRGDYLKALRSLALMGLSCPHQGGVTCAPSSQFMRDKCASQTEFCGLNFEQWFERAVPPGMQRDVKLLQDFYLQQAAELKP